MDDGAGYGRLVMKYILYCPKCGKTMVPCRGDMVDRLTVCDECFAAECVKVQATQKED